MRSVLLDYGVLAQCPVVWMGLGGNSWAFMNVYEHTREGRVKTMKCSSLIAAATQSTRSVTESLRGYSWQPSGVRRRAVLVILGLAALAVACTGQRATDEPVIPTRTSIAEAAETTVALTVYNEGTALVRDRRAFDFSRGFNEIAFTDVAASIDPTSVLFKSLTDPTGTSILEQNYQYDLVDSNALFKKYLDQLIRVVTEDGTLYEGRLLSSQGGIILQDEGGQVSVISGSVQEVSFPELPEGLITRPTLVWQLMADQAGSQEVEITYLTGGISWQADYVVLLGSDEQTIDLDGWVTLRNTSGTTYQDARLKLIAGDLQRQPQPGFAGQDLRFAAEADLAAAPVEQREFFEYKLYEVPRPVTVKNNENKQIEFVSVNEVPAEKFFVYDALQCRNNYWYCSFYGYPQTDPSYGIASNPKVMVLLEFDTEQAKADLPKGRVRVYQEDIDGAALLIGEDTIDHTPEGETVRLYVGDAFDIVGERIQTDFRRPSDKTLEESFEITLRNHKDEAVEVRVVEHLFRWSEWRVLRSSYDFEKLDSSTIEFRVRIPADGEITLDYDVRYNWP
ncbi:MAG: DUF4139 domain-containing protein [Anaerolineales bacterium]